ncbi:bifunctional adenosylcobinamide kinase/adenosylcobinamide-phosphate guanylyltransferase [Aquabacterium sp.]|uniref:bifunctional adenosylcobinamide kinase/adenosylcobinamide-phosphate guanylyltransferase n=1 Tax=Aquabacterium sp. TaxID=1872578 RepID=UPI001D4D7AA7|nr:bifunctional adenosylcobinamide kinase/adenosylcobinamide-phosphate guanylyltransferase [Aquabacterium sp.]MBT9610313.1 bifunctional adenosylcobinamide kinase/adenosylcobinamide-phosphate guanylyltransferase [Aquabacterium sp.]|tara:strand:- start:9 stop:614 length:606 start_codon:yes stop_codon:yes gene_type:complete
MNPHHLILGGQRSGKSRHAERLAQAWLQRSPQHGVTVVATAMASDDEMRERIARHRLDRPASFDATEAPLDLAGALRSVRDPQRLVLIDCLTLWVTNVLMPLHGAADARTDARADARADGLVDETDWAQRRLALLAALREREGPVVLVSNEIGMGVIPLGADVRRVVDELGRLHQDVAQCCGHITLMAAGQPFTQQVQRWA